MQVIEHITQVSEVKHIAENSIDKDTNELKFVDVEKWSEAYNQHVQEFLFDSPANIKKVSIIQCDPDAKFLLSKSDRYFRYGTLIHYIQFLPCLENLRLDLNGIAISGTLAYNLRKMSKLEKLHLQVDSSNPRFVKECLKLLPNDPSALNELTIMIPVKSSCEMLSQMDMDCLKRFPNVKCKIQYTRF